MTANPRALERRRHADVRPEAFAILRRVEAVVHLEQITRVGEVLEIGGETQRRFAAAYRIPPDRRVEGQKRRKTALSVLELDGKPGTILRFDGCEELALSAEVLRVAQIG